MNNVNDKKLMVEEKNNNTEETVSKENNTKDLLVQDTSGSNFISLANPLFEEEFEVLPVLAF